MIEKSSDPEKIPTAPNPSPSKTQPAGATVMDSEYFPTDMASPTAAAAPKSETRIEPGEMSPASKKQVRTASTPENPTVVVAINQEASAQFANMKIAVDEFVAKVLKKGPVGLEADFNTFVRTETRIMSDYSFWVQNPNKNRYKGVLCRDDTRVVLTGSGSDSYIHANFVTSPMGAKRYICTQAPKENTILDFWRMIFEFNSQVIVQLCNFIEEGYKKCAIYYPMDAGSTFALDKVKVTCDDETTMRTPGKVIRRQLTVSYNGKSHAVVHFTILNWQDHGVPQMDTTLLHVLQAIRTTTKTPIVVHCSAGIGRTGTFVFIENILEELMLGNRVDPIDALKRLRLERGQAVQKSVQYLYAMRVIVEYYLQVKQIPCTLAVKKFIDQYDASIDARTQVTGDVSGRG